ncbi:MAG: tRNA-binding protein [Calditrichaeota bacterium]|nr:MAG: tRNA-binding protein [Calditrichota bacterium]
MQATIEDFLKLDIRVGKILEAKEFPEAKKTAYKLKIDFGEKVGIKNSSAQITENYKIEDLVGKQILGVTNFPPRRIAGFKSEVLVLGINDENGFVTLLKVDKEIQLGEKVY